MRDKIIQEAYEKLCKGFDMEFISKQAYEKEYPVIAEAFSKRFEELHKEYLTLLDSKKREDYSQAVRSKVDFMNEGFEKNRVGNVWYNETDTERQTLNKYKAKNVRLYEKLSEQYDKLVAKRDESVLLPFFNFFFSKKGFLFELKGQSNADAVILQNLLSDFLQVQETIENRGFSLRETRASKFERIRNFSGSSFTSGGILALFKEEYEERYSEYMNLLDNVGKYLDEYKETISAFDDYCVNVGQREYGKNGYRLTNSFTLFYKNGEEQKGYRYENSSSDCREIKSRFVNIFIINASKGQLIKISVSPFKSLEYTPYLIYKQVQKVTIVDDRVVEVHIHKHFDREVIFCDSLEQARKLQQKILTHME